jgi:hypothetical protein
MAEEQDRTNSVEANKRDPKETVDQICLSLYMIMNARDHPEKKEAAEILTALRAIQFPKGKGVEYDNLVYLYAINVNRVVSEILSRLKLNDDYEVYNLTIRLTKYPLLLPKEYKELKSRKKSLATERKRLSDESIAKVRANTSDGPLPKTAYEVEDIRHINIVQILIEFIKEILSWREDKRKEREEREERKKLGK